MRMAAGCEGRRRVQEAVSLLAREEPALEEEVGGREAAGFGPAKLLPETFGREAPEMSEKVRQQEVVGSSHVRPR